MAMSTGHKAAVAGSILGGFLMAVWLGVSISYYSLGLLFAFGGSWVVFAYVIFPTTNNQENNVERQDDVARILHICIALFAAIATTFYTDESTFAMIITLGGLLRPVWGGLAAFGLGWAIWARYTLGAEWRGTPEVRKDHRLITYGPFAYTRHPIYTGVLALTLGNALYGGHWVGVLMAFVLNGLYMYKLGVEEAMLLGHFGSQYANYKKTTPRIIPFCHFI